MVLEILKKMLEVPDLANKKWIYEQYDSQVMNDTIAINGDAALVRIHGTQKALALTTDCTPRYVEADSYMGAIQAVAETYRNISATGAKPLAITNCLNFGNPQKPEIMGQIVRAIKGITHACKELDYPVVSGNVSLYNETNGQAIKPTPAIGGVGLLSDLSKRCDIKFKDLDNEIFIVGETNGHISCSIYEKEILKKNSSNNPPNVDLVTEKKNSSFIRNVIEDKIINSCHDISDGGMLVALFEMSSVSLGLDLDISLLKKDKILSDEQILFGEDQARFIVALNSKEVKEFNKRAEKANIYIKKIGKVIANEIRFLGNSQQLTDLIKINDLLFEKKFS